MSDALHWWLLAPFDYAFMRRALAACVVLALTTPVVGVLLTLRGMSLMGEALSHAILPGVALAFVLAGFSLPLMMLGGVAAGLVTVLLAGGVSLVAGLREDAAMASLFLTAMAAGVMGISLSGNALDLGHVLFGSILGVDRQTLLLVATAGSLVLAVLALTFRTLVVECLDPGFLTLQGRHAGWTQALFMGLVVISLVIGFQALGTLMAAGLMLLPAAMARFWSHRLEGMIAIATAWALVSGLAGLLASYHLALPAGPSIVLLAGAGYVVSILVGPKGGWLARRRQSRLRREVTP
ncbi:metal ABC transporter permease [Halomonas salifodinae]|uniref:Metal ABC transporter permease n=1 Tax=Halomonas salifodinae TaxID=438745 RepID=A0ABW2EUI9_9GAMM